MASTDRSGWYVISLRPQGGHAGVRAAAARHGAKLLALSPWRLQARDDAATRADLVVALRGGCVLFTSPAAVSHAVRLQPLRRQPGQTWVAVGDGTAAALVRAGIDVVVTPVRKDSEGLLALPVLQAVRGVDIGLVTAPGGRGLLAPMLEQRGARVHRADVYERVPRPLPARAVQGLERLDARACLLLSSGEALSVVLAALPEVARARLLQCGVAAASARLARQAGEAGFARVDVAEGPQPAQLVRAAARLVHVAATPAMPA